ncbi:glycine N-acyltransferase-like isoform X2 [Pteronotus mesoamericanus]|uniref:glycine N-acyltransferase-like isoform X2 n=1 Tax=Pteronotus mesoamericanus TaxID=1884717 RepID=UPI0023EB4B23|nr:glycine N-acyltransferase-like isoform X2 [Pteronotus parnellii mesoamericanus]
MMFQVQGAQMLRKLEGFLRKSLPESLKVYGTVFHMNKGNPYKLKALVDEWPDFNTVVVRPQEQEMVDDFDCYTNTYQIYSKDPGNCQELLGSPGVINWKQHLQIQTLDSVKTLMPSLLDTKNVPPGDGKPKSINEEMFKLSSLDVTHAALVNEFWHFGGNERSQRFIKHCIQNFPNFCLLGPEGTPISWNLMDQTGEMRMAGTIPEYRCQGLISYLIYNQTQALNKLGFPLYCHVDKKNKIMQKVIYKMQFICMPCSWNQWHCVPL